jgi:tetratricopeptide (TPR) repeat protein
MAEAAPLLIAGGVGEQSNAEEVSRALELVENALFAESSAGQQQAARRCFDNAAKILEVAENKRFKRRLRPSAAYLHYLVGNLEMEWGELGRAKPHIDFAVREEPTFDAWMRLAAIDRQQGDTKGSLDGLDHALRLAQSTGDAAAEAESQLAKFEIYRDKNDAEAAKQALAAALNRALDARKLASTDSMRSRSERLLAQVLEHYGDLRGARRATERAYDAARTSPGQLRMTILDAASRALTRSDLDAARDAVRRAIDASLSDEDVVYPALWLQLLEKKLRVPSDGTAEEAFGAVDEGSGWPAKLRSWARGKLTDKELLAAARDRAQQTEAAFYIDMATNGFASPKLKQIADSPVDLMEVAIARDLVAQAKPPVNVQLPPDVALP